MASVDIDVKADGEITEPREDSPMAALPENAAEILEINSTSLTPVQQAVIRTFQVCIVYNIEKNFTTLHSTF